MRRSQAPSLRNFAKTSSHSESKENEVDCVQKRSTDLVLSLVLHGNQNDASENKVKEETPAPRIDNMCGEIAVDKKESDGIPVNPVSKKLNESVKIFNVVFGKQSKRKHKVWEGDGTLEVGEKLLTLRDENGKILGTSVSKSKTLEEGSQIFVGSKEVEIISELTQSSEVAKKPLSPVKQTIKKRKLSGKGFIVPSLKLMDKNKYGLTFPEPNAEHQWHFNANGLPVTQVCIDGNLARSLRQHQKEGITFLYECVMGFKSISFCGAILADEMGLGKTLQTISLIWTLLKQGPYGNRPVLKKVLIVTPSSLTMNWHAEFMKWLGREKLVPYVVDSKNRAQDARSPIMIVSYEMFLRNFEDIKDTGFDLLVCDEGHRLKNGTTRTTQLLQQLNCQRRILLTGTPIQNDLKEFYRLVDFVNPGFLGTPACFHRDFEEPILASRDPSASEEVRLRGEECAADLNRKTSLFLLRRTKEVLEGYLPSKNEVIVFCKTTDIQREVYNYIINALVDSREKLFGPFDGLLHLGVIVSLKKLCNHPSLLWKKDDNDFKGDDLLDKISNSFANVKGNEDAELGAKLLLVLNFLRELRERFPRERTVVVSNSTQTLNLLEKKINEAGLSTCRLDGSTNASQRSRIVDNFNKGYSSTSVFLLSSKAGGVGLNLSGASRLILYDSDWNPATDLQAMSRIWRDGQSHSVYIYRLLTSGTIEEKIFQRQVNKQGLGDGVIDPQKGTATKLRPEEMKDIFSVCDIEEGCLTHDALSCDCCGSGSISTRRRDERRSCQLGQSESGLKMNELLEWEHHASPADPSLLSELCLLSSRDVITYIFRNCKK